MIRRVAPALRKPLFQRSGQSVWLRSARAASSRFRRTSATLRPSIRARVAASGSIIRKIGSRHEAIAQPRCRGQDKNLPEVIRCRRDRLDYLPWHRLRFVDDQEIEDIGIGGDGSRPLAWTRHQVARSRQRYRQQIVMRAMPKRTRDGRHDMTTNPALFLPLRQQVVRGNDERSVLGILPAQRIHDHQRLYGLAETDLVRDEVPNVRIAEDPAHSCNLVRQWISGDSECANQPDIKRRDTSTQCLNAIHEPEVLVHQLAPPSGRSPSASLRRRAT
jgi:hypothetical protein